MRHARAHSLDTFVPLLVGALIAVGIWFRADSSTRAQALLLGLAAAATLVARRRLPTLTLALSGALVLGLVAVDRPSASIAVIAPAAALYTLALTRDRRRLAVAVAAAAGAVVAVEVFRGGSGSRGMGGQIAAHVALIAIPVLAAEALRNHRGYVRLLRERADVAERTREDEAQRRAEQERLRIARDLHDVVAHTLTTINVQAGVVAHLLEGGANPARDALATIEAASHDALDELRSILGVLREPDDTMAPRMPAPDLDALGPLLDQARSGGLAVAFTATGERPDPLADGVQLAGFRIVQEALTNARRHAPGVETAVRLAYLRDTLAISIENPLRGGESNGSHPGVGILGMQERARALGGTLTAGRDGDVSRVVAELPLPAVRVIRLLLAEDRAAVRAGFAALIEAEPDMEVVGEAADGRAAVDIARRVFPHVVLMDIRMPILDGIEATRLICSDHTLTAARVLVLTTFDLDDYVYSALRAGASGFLLKDAGPAQLLHAIRVLADGDALLAPSITRRLIAEFVARPDPTGIPPRALAALTGREREIMALVAEGLSNAEIAERLVISPLTAKTHVGRILNKLGCRDRAQLVVLAYETGLVLRASGRSD